MMSWGMIARVLRKSQEYGQEREERGQEKRIRKVT